MEQLTLSIFLYFAVFPPKVEMLKTSVGLLKSSDSAIPLRMYDLWLPVSNRTGTGSSCDPTCKVASAV